MPLALTGSMTAVQFRYPAELPWTLNKLKRFETGACVKQNLRGGIIFSMLIVIHMIRWMNLTLKNTFGVTLAVLFGEVKKNCRDPAYNP